MSTMFVFVLALFLGENPILGEDVTFLRMFDTNKECTTFIETVDLPEEAKESLLCLVVVKPGIYRDQDET